jgi:general secretion pathway protein K
MKGFIKGERGIALFLVLWVLTLLSVIAGEFCFAMRTEVNITRNFKEQTTAYYIALAGVNRAIGELIRNEVILQQVGQPKVEEEEEVQEGEEEQDRWRINVDIPPVPYGKGQFKVEIGNERGKININEANEALLKIMLSGFDIDEQQKNIIVDSIIDWRDDNNLYRLNGAEDDYYKSLPEPYECKDGDFDSVEELLMVRGITPEIFYGGLKDVVTEFHFGRSRSKTKLIYKIYINAASRKMLLTLPSITEALADEIINYRKNADFKSLTEISSLLGSDVFQSLGAYITLEKSPFHNIVSVGKVEGTQIRQGVEAMVEINVRLKKGYRIVQWRDTFEHQSEQSTEGVQ